MIEGKAGGLPLFLAEAFVESTNERLAFRRRLGTKQRHRNAACHGSAGRQKSALLQEFAAAEFRAASIVRRRRRKGFHTGSLAGFGKKQYGRPPSPRRLI